MPEINEIPLDEIVRDGRVQEYVKKKAREMAKKHISRYDNHRSQIFYCHAWLLTLHYGAIHRLQEKYNISRPEFIVLLSVHLLQRLERSSVYAKAIKELLSWMHNRIYRHLKKLSKKGFIRIEKNIYNRKQRYFVSLEGRQVIRAFSQYYWQVFHGVVDRWRELPDSFIDDYF